MSKIQMEPINGFIHVAEHTNDESIKRILSGYAKSEIDDFVSEFINYLRDNDYTFDSTNAYSTYDKDKHILMKFQTVETISLPDLQNAMFQFIWEYCKKTI